MQNPPIDPQLLKSAIFGMKRRAMDRDNQSFQQQFQNHTMKQLADMQSQGMTREQAMKDLQGQQQSRIDQDEQRRAAFDQSMSNMQAQRNNPLYSMSPQGRNAALGRSVDQQMLQEKVDAQNQQVQNIQKERALAQQMRAQGNNSFANTIERRMGTSNEQIGNQPQYSQQQVASNRGGQQQPNQNMAGYDQAKANLLKMNPNLGIAGHADNTNFINSLKASYGDNYREHLQKNPQLLAQHYSSMQPQNTNQSVASQPASPVPAAPAGSVPSTPIPNSPYTMSGNPSANLAGSTVSPGSGQVNPVANKPASPVQPVAAANTAAPQLGNAGPVAPPNAGPSDAYLTKVMGSYNPRSKLDQAKASRIREMYSAGNTSPENIYTDKTYSGISSKTPTTVVNSAQPATNTPIGVPKTARDSSAELLDPESQDTFRKAAGMFGLSDYVVEESLHEITKEKTASSEEGRFMNYLREELFKTAKDMGDHCPYSPKELSLISSSAENFQKAAMLEAQSFWIGLSEDLLKRGRDESFLKGILKAAGDFSEEVGLEADPSTPAGGLLSTLGEGAKKLMESGAAHGTEAMQGLSQGVSSLGETAKGLGQAAGTAAQNAGQAISSAAKSVGQAAGTAGSEMKDAATETLGRLKEQSGPAIEQLKQTSREAAAKGKDFFKDITSSLTPEDDRHQIIPGVGNQYLGAAGGALLSALMGGQMGLTGPASWLVPLLGGAAGYHYLPKLMNMWKDQPGTGTKSISPGAAAYNQQNPIISKAMPVAPGGSMSPSGNLGALSPKPV
jgi:hypothetical protein